MLTPQVGGQAVLGRQDASPTPWLTERHGYVRLIPININNIVMLGHPLQHSSISTLYLCSETQAQNSQSTSTDITGCLPRNAYAF